MNDEEKEMFLLSKGYLEQLIKNIEESEMSIGEKTNTICNINFLIEKISMKVGNFIEKVSIFARNRQTGYRIALNREYKKKTIPELCEFIVGDLLCIYIPEYILTPVILALEEIKER